MLRNRANAKQRPANPKIENLPKVNARSENSPKAYQKIENPMKISGSSTKLTSKIFAPENQTKKTAEVFRKKNAQSSVSRKLSDNRLNEITIDKEKVISERKTSAIKSLQVTGQKNIKALKDYSVATKVNAKVDSKDLMGNKVAETKSSKVQNKMARKIDTKASSISLKTLEEKLNNVKSKSSTTPKVNTTKKPAPRPIQEVQVKPKSRGKRKKIGHSKSTILSTSADLLNDHSPIKDDSFDLVDLIQASLKNIRSPRSIFDYSFSCIEKTKSCGGDTTTQDISRKMTDHPRALKSGHIKTALDRLSEKSEPVTAKSIDSANKGELSYGSVTPNSALMSLNSELKKWTELNKNRNVIVPEEKAEHFERYGIYNKYPTPRLPDKEHKKSPPAKEMDKTSILRSLGMRSFRGKNVSSNSTAEVNRYESRKMIDNVYKY